MVIPLQRRAVSPGLARVLAAKAAYTTRLVDLSRARSVCGGDGVPRPGDLVLAEVAVIGQHRRIERRDGRRASLYPGDEVVVAYGHRYAPDQFEAEVPPDLGACHLVAAGGIAGRVLASHESMQDPTELLPAGLLVDEAGRRMNLLDGRRPVVPVPALEQLPLTVAVVGGSMNAGKTTAAAHLVRGLSMAGRKVGAAKVTGTGAGGDPWMMTDAGAAAVYDFTDAGLATTYRASPHEVRRVLVELQDRLTADECDVIVIEIADGLYQAETAELLSSVTFAERVDGVLFAARDALGATAGLAWMHARGLPVMALCGVLSSSPLAVREAETNLGMAVWGADLLREPELAVEVLRRLRALRRNRTLAEAATLSVTSSPVRVG